MNTFITDLFSVEQINTALELGEQQTKGILSDLRGHMLRLEGVDVTLTTSGAIFKSITSLRTRQVIVLKNKIVVDTLWHDGSCDTKSTTFPLEGHRLLRLLTSMEIIHA